MEEGSLGWLPALVERGEHHLPNRHPFPLAATDHAIEPLHVLVLVNSPVLLHRLLAYVWLQSILHHNSLSITPFSAPICVHRYFVLTVG
jgi:hypothetical protein